MRAQGDSVELVTAAKMKVSLSKSAWVDRDGKSVSPTELTGTYMLCLHFPQAEKLFCVVTKSYRRRGPLLSIYINALSPAVNREEPKIDTTLTM